MNLIVDIGNSTAKAAVFDGNHMVVRKRLGAAAADALAMLASDFPIDACACGSVGADMPAVRQMLEHIAPGRVLHVNGLTPVPLVIAYRTPETLGADRLAAAVGAAALMPAAEVLVIDVGTCITLDRVTADGRYLGGNISLGMGMRLRALHDQTARLPLVGTDGPQPDFGYDTATAIRSGVIQGMAREIEGYVARFQRLHERSKVFLTGGNAYRFAQELDVERNDTLVETGLNAILAHNTH